MKLEWSDCARDDPDDLVRYISRDSGFYARRFAERVVLAARRSQAFPESGRMIPEVEDKTLREIIVQGWMAEPLGGFDPFPWCCHCRRPEHRFSSYDPIGKKVFVRPDQYWRRFAGDSASSELSGSIDIHRLPQRQLTRAALRMAARASASFPAPGGTTLRDDVETRPANFVAGGAPRH